MPLATQEQFLADAARIRQFRQNAGIFRRNLVSYFPQSARGDAMQWVALPGDGLIREPVVIPAELPIRLG